MERPCDWGFVSVRMFSECAESKMERPRNRGLVFVGDDIRDWGLVVCLRDVVKVLTVLQVCDRQRSDQKQYGYCSILHNEFVDLRHQSQL